MTIKELRQMSGLSQAEFAKKYEIPKRSIENWEEGKRVPPPYLIKLLGIAISREKEKEKET